MLLVTLASLIAARRSTSRDLFRSNCARCHAADGRGDTALGHTFNAPDFTDPSSGENIPASQPPESLVSIVSHGKGGMLAFRKKLTSTEVRLLVVDVRRFKNQ